MKRILTVLLMAVSGISSFALDENNVVSSERTVTNTDSTSRVYFITEAGYHFRINAVPERKIVSQGEIVRQWGVTGRHYFTSDLGVMISTSSRFAVGASHLLALNSSGEFQGGIKARIRYQLKPGLSIDVSPGFYLWNIQNNYSTPGFTCGVQLNKGNTFALSVVIERLCIVSDAFGYGYFEERIIQSAHDTGVYLGLKVGGILGLAANGVAATMTAILGVLWMFSDD